MNVVTVAPAPPPRTRSTAPASAAGADDFAALLAGLGGSDPSCGPAAAPLDAATTDRPLHDEDTGVQPVLDTGTLAPPATAPVAAGAPVVQAPAAGPSPVAVPGSAAEAVTATSAADASSGPAAPAASTTPAPGPARPAAGPVVPGRPDADGAGTGTDQAAATTGPGAPADARRPVQAGAVLQTAVQQVAGQQVADRPGSTPPLDGGQVAAGGPAVAPLAAPAQGSPGAAAQTAAPLVQGTTAPAVDPGATGALTSDPVTTAAPDALQLDVPADLADDAAVPVLDARVTASPAGSATGSQTAGAAVADAMLPVDAALAATSAPAASADALRPDATAPALAAPGAEAGVAAPQAAELRTGAPVAAAAAPPPPPATQVVQLLAPVLEGPDGSYNLSLQLYPEELGAVQVDVVLRGGEIRLALHAPDEAAQAALRSALPDLRAELQAGGLTATSVSVDDGRPGSSPQDRTDSRSSDRRPDGSHDQPGRRSSPYRPAEPAPGRPTSRADAPLDLRM